MSRLTATGLLATALLLGVTTTAAFADDERVDAEIAYLLEYVQRSDCVFVRNGNDHAPEDAAEHIRKKFRHFRKKIKTTDDFIKRAATGSLMSGKPYQVRCPPHNETEATAEWLRAALRAHRKNLSH